MFLSPSLVLFILSILTSMFLILSSSSLFVSWLGLELNMLAFIPLLVLSKNKFSSEAAVKYFLTQTLASILFVVGLLAGLIDASFLMYLLVFLGLCIKLGAAPFHSWLLTIAESSTWVVLLVLLTIQKINPLLIMWNLDLQLSNLCLAIILVSVLVGGFMGLIQTSPRLILAFSSINHLGWLLISLFFSIWLGVVYFVSYFLVLVPVVSLFRNSNLQHINQLTTLSIPSSYLILMFLSLLSLGGLPPFFGFLPKWVVLQSLMFSGHFILGFILVLVSLFTLYYYLRLTFSAFILSKSVTSLVLAKSNKIKAVDLVFLGVSLLGLSFIFLI
uniref:NADH dehydrogenase subunit 2 n=1 Tax=Simocephalus serrulatus TaxID=117539 RepID=UPI001EDFE2A1|nr:NADH dehydrogenase subunit 2 [Simocephalus serrulatus]UKB87182.1 NADH dehydrogenase subunit 2 [Simocephalus serrulatus]